MSKDRLNPAPSVAETLMALKAIERQEGEQNQTIRLFALGLCAHASALRKQDERVFPWVLQNLMHDDPKAFVAVLNHASGNVAQCTRRNAYSLFYFALYTFGYTGRPEIRESIRHLVIAILANHLPGEDITGPWARLLDQAESLQKQMGDTAILSEDHQKTVAENVRMRLAK